jgi:predicted DNA-binding transcriptional regulator AlpA
MVIKINDPRKPNQVTFLENTPTGQVKRIVVTPAKKAPSKTTKPQAPEISLSQPGRLRVANLMSLLGVSRTTLYAGVNSGRYPAPDGKDGRIPYWNTDTIRKYLDMPSTNT